MTIDDLQEVNARLSRMVDRLENKSSIGFSQSFVASDGKTYNVHVKNLKSFDEYEDDLRNAIIWAWSIKDYLKEVSKSLDKSPRGIESIVDRHLSLKVLSDLANGSKHGVLNKSRSTHFATMKSPKITIPQEAVSSIIVGAFDVTAEVEFPNLVQYKAEVINSAGKEMAEAGEILIQSITIWETEGLAYATGV